MSKQKPFGFLQEDFHSEVLSFLFELVSTKFPDRQMILYNNKDRYDNKGIYKQKYTNLEVRDLQYFFPDANNNVCETTFIVSYDNIIHFSMLLHYKQNLMFIAHSPKHVDTFQKHNVKYFALTGLLSTNFMLPITNEIYTDVSFLQPKLNVDNAGNASIANIEVILQPKLNVDNAGNASIANIEVMQTIRDRNMTVLLIVGSFFENNKDISLLKTLIDTGKYILVICTTELTNELKNFVEDNQDYVYVSLNLTTKDLQLTIKYFNVKYLLFTPPKNSKFYTSSWSGSIQFAFDNDLHIVIPEILANIYNINNSGVITYNSIDDILLGIETGSCLNLIKEYQTIRDNIFCRNKVVFDVLLNDIQTSNVGHFKINYHEQQTEIDTKVNVCQKIIDATLTPEDIKRIKDTTIITIDPDDCIFMLTCVLLQRDCNIEAFIKDLDTAKYYKNIFTFNNMNKRIKFFYGLLSSRNSNNQIPEIFTLDHLKYKNKISIIYTNSDLIEDVILGGKNTIQKYNPLIFVKNKSNTNDNYKVQQLLTNYSVTTIDNFLIYKPIKL
jgi:hypothetical protein